MSLQCLSWLDLALRKNENKKTLLRLTQPPKKRLLHHAAFLLLPKAQIPPILIVYMKKLIISSFFVLTLLITAGNAWSQDVLIRRIQDDSALRISLLDSWFREVPARVLGKSPEYYVLRGGSRVQVRVETSAQNRDEFAIVIAREQNGAYSGWAQGSWVLTRRRDNDPSGMRIRVFLRSDYNTYVQFRPFSDEKCHMDVVLYDGYVMRSHPLPVPFERLFTMQLDEILGLAANAFPLRYFEPEPDMYRDTRAFIARVRARLNELFFLDDGAQDENGNFVFINTLAPQARPGGVNCSGFVKWIVDGLLRPITGERLAITPLKARFGERGTPFTDTWEELRDPFFGLDWARNLASTAGTVLRSPAFGVLDEIEVRGNPFSYGILRQASGSTVFAYPGYIQNAGFGFEGLYPLLYTLAIDEPGRIYLASVNDELGAPETPDNPRGLPRIRQYYHEAVLVPYFTERGVFQVAVFESGEETSFSAFRNRYPGQFVNLVRIPIDGTFDP